MSDRRLTYWFGPLERRGLLGPVRAGQAAVIAAGGVAGIAALDASPSALGVLAAGALLAVALAATCVPVGSRTTEEWLPLTLAFGWRRLGRRRFASAAATAGTRVRRAGPRGLRGRPPTPVAPPQLRDVGLAASDYHGRPLGILSERSGRRLTSVLACRVLAFSLLDQDAQERRLARWGLVLSGAGGTRDQTGAVDRAHRPRPGRRARALGPRRARPGGPAARHADDRLLPRADLLDRARRPGARGPAGDPGRRPARARSRRGRAPPAPWWSRPSASPRAWRPPRSRSWARSAPASWPARCGRPLIRMRERS